MTIWQTEERTPNQIDIPIRMMSAALNFSSSWGHSSPSPSSEVTPNLMSKSTGRKISVSTPCSDRIPRTRFISASVWDLSGERFRLQLTPSAFRPAPASAPSDSAIPSPFQRVGDPSVGIRWRFGPQRERNVTAEPEMGRSVRSAAVSSYDKIKDLPLEVDGYELQGLEFQVPDAFERLTTIIHLKGGGHEGLGEDVVYDALDHVAFQDAGPALDLAGEHTIASFAELLDGLELFPTPPEREVSVNYRRWAFESAALDLALRQAEKPLHDVLGREPRPVTFVVSMRLTPPGSDEVSTIEPVRKRLEVYPTLRFKLDPTNDWTDELIGQLVETGAIDSLDLKGQYKGTPVDVETDPELYRKLIEAFPEAWLEDPDVTDETKPILDPVADRVTWDAVIHSVDDIQGQPWQPKMVNIKPSRFGPLHELFAGYDFCDENGIGAYGGGQWELGPGRGHIQYLASIFHPDTPNDVAPSGYNTAGTEPGLPSSPLEPMPTETGFRWGE